MEDLDQEAAADRRHQGQDHGLHLPHPPALEVQSSTNVSNAVTRQPQSSGSPKSSFSAMIVPSTSARSVAAIATSASTQSTQLTPRRILGPAGLRQVVPRHHPQPRRQRLEQHGHQVRHQQDPDQRVAEPGPALQVGRPVARVHVADAHQVRRPQEREQPAQPLPASPGGRDVDRAVDLLQRLPSGRVSSTTAISSSQSVGVKTHSDRHLRRFPRSFLQSFSGFGNTCCKSSKHFCLEYQNRANPAQSGFSFGSRCRPA